MVHLPMFHNTVFTHERQGSVPRTRTMVIFSLVPSRMLQSVCCVLKIQPCLADQATYQVLIYIILLIMFDFRYYNALYKKLLDKELPQTSHQAVWINLMLKSIRKDSNIIRKKSFIKRILQVCSSIRFSISPHQTVH